MLLCALEPAFANILEDTCPIDFSHDQIESEVVESGEITYHANFHLICA